MRECNCPCCPSAWTQEKAKELLKSMGDTSPFCMSCTCAIAYEADPFSAGDNEPSSKCRRIDCLVCPVGNCHRPLTTAPKTWEKAQLSRFACCGHPVHKHCQQRMQSQSSCPACMYSPLPKMGGAKELEYLLGKAELFREGSEEPHIWFAPYMVAERYYADASKGKENIKEAMKWWQIQARDDPSHFQTVHTPENGGIFAVAAQLRLGQIFAMGKTDEHMRKARFWLEKAAQAGHPVAQFELSKALSTLASSSTEDAVSKSKLESEALHFAELAAAQGYATGDAFP